MRNAYFFFLYIYYGATVVLTRVGGLFQQCRFLVYSPIYSRVRLCLYIKLMLGSTSSEIFKRRNRRSIQNGIKISL